MLAVSPTRVSKSKGIPQGMPFLLTKLIHCVTMYNALINDVYAEKILQDIFRHFTQKQVTKIFINLFWWKMLTYICCGDKIKLYKFTNRFEKSTQIVYSIKYNKILQKRG